MSVRDRDVSLKSLFSIRLFMKSVAFILKAILFFLLLLLGLELGLGAALLCYYLRLVLIISLSAVFFVF